MQLSGANIFCSYKVLTKHAQNLQEIQCFALKWLKLKILLRVLQKLLKLRKNR